MDKKVPLDKIFAEALLEGCRGIIKENVENYNPYYDLFISKLSKSKRISYAEAEALYGIYRRDPVYFMTDFLHSRKPWGRDDCGIAEGPEMGQMEIIEAVKAGHKKIVVRSGNGVGKGWISARVGLWFLHCFPPAIVITTAPTNRGVEKLLWGEIRSAYRRALFQISDCNLKELKFDDLWYAIGFSSTKEIENFQGYHSPNIMVIGDEASGLDAMVMDALGRNLTSANAHWFLIGNPLNTSGPFFDCFKKSDWHKVHIDSELSPNVISGREVIPGLVSRHWIEQRKKEYGEKSPLYQITAKGNFSESGTNNLISLMALNDSKDCTPPDLNGRHMALDVARYGDDSNRAVLVVDNIVKESRVWSHCGLMDTSGRALELYKEWGIDCPENFHIDVCGVGGGVVDRLYETLGDVDAVDFGAGAGNSLLYKDIVGEKIRFKNRRAELYYTLKRLLEEKRFCIPEQYGEAWADLTAPAYTFDSSGNIVIEAKEKIKERLGRSPDFGDAIVLSLSRGNVARFRSLK